MAKKKVGAEIKVEEVKAKKEVVTMAMVIAEVREVQAQKSKKLADYNKVECPDLNLRQFYDFEFNQNVSNKYLRGTIRRVTGELAMHYIKSNYGILC
jgi:hypothetical protein